MEKENILEVYQQNIKFLLMARWTFEWCQLHISIFHIIVLTKYIILYLWHENQYHNTKILCHYIFKNIISKAEEYSSCLSVFFMSQIWFPSQEIQLFSKHLTHTGKISSNITRTSTYIFFLGFFLWSWFFCLIVFRFGFVFLRYYTDQWQQEWLSENLLLD